MNRQLRLAPRMVLGGGLDVLLAALLAGLSSVLGGLHAGQVWPVGLDVLMCIAAGCTVRWPKTAGLVLGLLLMGYFFVPAGSASLGEYAPLIPILGTGMRGWRLARRWMTFGYGAILVALQFHDYPGSPLLFLLGGLVWAVLIAGLWLIGNAFAAFRQAQAEAHAAALVQQRLSLARDLHDTVARDLSRAVLRAQLAQQSLDQAEMSAVVSEIQAALSRLRVTMALLRDPQPETAGQIDDAGSPGEVLREATHDLKSAGFAVALTIEGEVDAIPPRLWPTIRAVVGEAVSNIERHASKSGPCALILSVDPRAADMVFINHAERPHESPTAVAHPAMGLLGVRERITPIGGELDTLQEDRQWMTRIRVPLGDQQSSGS